MSRVVRRYNPNFAWGKQVVEVVLQMWDYRATMLVEIGGNTLGQNVLECAASILDGKLEGRVNLTNPKGRVLECVDEENDGEEWLKNMIVSLRIIKMKPPTLNEIRKRNGAGAERRPTLQGDDVKDPT